MKNKAFRIDLKKLTFYLIRRCWLIIICAVIGFTGLYAYTRFYQTDTYSAFGTMYVLNGNPNLVNYQYTNSSDLNSALQLIDTYMVVVRSKKVLNVVTERLAPTYPGITPDYIGSTLSMGSVGETGVLRVICTTTDPQLSADICNAVMDVAPSEIIRVVSAGNIEIIDYADTPIEPDYRAPKKKGVIGAIAGGAAAGALLVFLYLINRKVSDTDDLTENYNVPILASVKRQRKNSADPGAFRISPDSAMETLESYAKLRMNLFFTLAQKEQQVIEVTSSISGEGKSTIAANLAISCAMSGKRVLLIDGDMRRSCQRSIFGYDDHAPGLSEALIQSCAWQDAVIHADIENLDLLPSGQIPPNPAELLSTPAMKDLLAEAAAAYDLVFVDAPPINIVSDPLVLSSLVTGCLFVARQNYSDHREIRKALIAAEMSGMNVLGLVFYGERIHQDSYYGRKYYKKYGDNYEKKKRETAENKKREPVVKPKQETVVHSKREPVKPQAAEGRKTNVNQNVQKNARNRKK